MLNYFRNNHTPYWKDWFLVGLFFILLYAYQLGTRPFAAPDEGRYVEIPREMVATGDYLTPHLNGLKYFEKPVLFYWMQTIPLKLFGMQEGAMRLWTLIFGVLGCLLTYTLGRFCFGRHAGLLSAAILGTTYLYYAFTRLILLDLVLSVLILGAFVTCVIGLAYTGQKRRYYAWATAVLLALAVLTKGLVALVIFGGVFLIWLTLTGQWKSLLPLYLPSSLVIFLAIAAPWHILVSLKNPPFFDFYFIQEHFLRYLTPMHKRTQPGWFFLPVVFVGFMPWTAFMPRAFTLAFAGGALPKKERNYLWLMLIWVIFVFTFFSLGQSKLITYMIPLFPPLAILIGRLLTTFLRHQRSIKPELIGTSAIAIGIIGGFFSLRHLIPADDLASLEPFILNFIYTLGLGAFVALVFIMKVRMALFGLFVVAIVQLIMLNEASIFTTRVSAKETALAIKEKMPRSTEVLTYRTYFQDLPPYLDRTVTIVEWGGELQFGQDLEPEKKQRITTAEMWERWQAKDNPVCIVTDQGRFDKLKEMNPDFNPIILVNKPTVYALCNREPEGT